MNVQVKKFPNAAAAAEACGADILTHLESARRERGIATVAVSGGSSPRIMFEWMARQSFDWHAIDIYWVDERCVPADDGQSNYRMTREALLDSIQLAPGQIHRIRGELLPDEAATLYAEEIARCFRLPSGELPVFDVLQRGMGPDAHTASLFPGQPLIENRTGIAAAVWVEKFHQHRVTLLPGVLERARRTVCLVSGAEKQEALRKVLHGTADPIQLPAQISSAEMVWYVDNAALGE